MKDDFKGVEIDQFKDEDIIKALKYCIDENVPCDNCPCWKNCCTLEKDCLSLINRQKAEIYRYKGAIKTFERDVSAAYAEIERLGIELQSMRSAANSYKMHYETAKSEAIKEFAYFVIDKSRNGVIYASDIPDLVKEMTEVEINQRKEDEGK